MVQPGAMQRLRGVADVVSHHTARGDEAQNVAVLQIVDHRFPDLPNTERQAPLFGSHALGSEPIEVVFPRLRRQVARIFEATLEHRFAALDVANVDIREVLDRLVRARKHPDVVGHVGERNETVATDAELFARRDRFVGEPETLLVGFE